PTAASLHCCPTAPLSLSFVTHPSTTYLYTLSLHDALPILFFGFGNTQLSFVVFRHPLAEGVNQGSWWVSHCGFDVGSVFGQHHEIDVNHFLTREAVEISIYECTSDFARAVSTEVHENQRIAVFHCRIWLTFCTNNGRFHELVVFVASISCLQTSNGSIGLELTLRQSQQVIGFFNAIPTVIAVHRVVTTNDGRYAAFTQRSKFLFKFFQRGFSTARRGVATVKECVQVDFFCAAFSCQFYHRHDVIFVAVYAACGEQTHNVYCFTCVFRFIYRASQHWISKESAIFDFNVQTSQVLIHD